jgi:diguanylate cyclase
VGRVHSRINISLSLINYAKVILKRTIFEAALSDQPRSAELACYMSDVIDYSVDMFNESYLSEVVDNARHRQSLRVITTGHQLALDLERGKGEIAGWIRDLVWNAHRTENRGIRSLSGLNFSSWLKHKGSFTFNDEALVNKMLGFQDELETIETWIRQFSSDPTQLDAVQPQLEQALATSDQLLQSIDELIEQVLTTERTQDSLTKTLSRRYLPSIAQKEVVFAKSTGFPFSVMMIDIDNFKQINDSYGHSSGDTVLEGVARAIMERLRPGDYVFRYGGEEFMVLVNETTLDVARLIAEDIRTMVAGTEHHLSDKPPVRTTVSIGCTQYDFHPDFMRSVDRADDLLYQAKREGKNRVIAQ